MFPPDQTAELSTPAGRKPPRADLATAADSFVEGRSEFEEPAKVGVWEEGAIINERYTLERRLGSGSMGEVFLASDRLLKKQVALKVLRGDLAKSRATVRRFLREVALAHSVTHPNVVRIHDTGEADGLPFFSMEHLQGQTLDELVEASRIPREAEDDRDPGDPPMTLREIREISYEILSGLAAAHEAGIVHRDLKPANVMLTHRGAIVMDFGVAGFDAPTPGVRPNPAEARSLVRTEAGTIFGSPAYMAPELWEGSPATVQSDLYSFGVMLYQMLSGRLPIEAANAKAFLIKLQEEKPIPIRQLRKDTPWNLALLVSRCMNPDPNQRPVSAEAAANLVAPLAGRWRWILLGGVVLVVAIAAFLFLRNDDRAHRDMGLPDAAAVGELEGFVHSYDTADFEAATRQLDRLELRAPDSAAVVFWRATLAHELGDDAARLRACEDAADHHDDRGLWRGGDTWQAMAARACADAYSLASPMRNLLDPRARSTLPDDWLPLAVYESLIPRLEAARKPGATLLGEAEDVLERLDRGHDFDDGPPMPIRWQLARIDLRLALGRVDEAEVLLEALVDDRSDSPRVLARAAHYYALTGEREQAAVWAESVAEYDPRPAVRMLLDQGRLRDAASVVDRYAVSRGRHPHLTQLTEMWCGYAYRFEIEPGPARCGAVAPGMVHNLWVRARTDADDQLAMSTLGRAIISQQAALNRNECLVRGENPSILTQAIPPFETYLRQLDIATALCAGTSDSRRLARRLGDELLARTPGEPWALLIDAQVLDAFGEAEIANDVRRQAARRWRNADPDLPLVIALRELIGEPSPDPAAPAAPADPTDPADPASPSDSASRALDDEDVPEETDPERLDEALITPGGSVLMTPAELHPKDGPGGDASPP